VISLFHQGRDEFSLLADLVYLGNGAGGFNFYCVKVLLSIDD
jgi:hypothetical protein